MATDSKRILIRIDVSEKNASVNINKAKKSVDGLATSTERLAKANNKNRAQSGLNNAILIETGRVASDASFGIQGVANNIGRLTELFQEFSRTGGGGVREAFSQLGKSLMGVGGLIVGFQLLLSFAPKLLKAFEGASAKAKKLAEELDKVKEETEGTREELNAYFKVLTDYNLSQERRLNLEKQIIDKLPDIENLNTKSKEGIDQLRKSIDLYVKQQMIRAEIDLLLEQNQEDFLEDRKRRDVLEKVRLAKSQKEQIDIIKENTNIFERLSIEMMGADGKGLIQRIIEGDRYETTDLIKGFENFVNKEGSGVIAARDRIAELTSQLIEYSKSSGGANKRTKEFTEGLFDISKFILQYRKQADKIFVQNEQERIDLEEDFAKQEANRRLRVFIDSQKKRLEEYKERVKGRKNANKLIANAEIELNNSIEDARVKHGEALLTIEDAYITKRILLADKQGNLKAKSDRKIEDAEINSLKNRIDANQTYYDEKIRQVANDLELDRIRLETTKLNLEDELALRESIAKQQILLEQLKLKAKVDSINEQKRIDLEYISFAKGIGSLLATLAGQNEALQKAALIVEKGAAIADIVIKTQASNQIIRATSAASAPPPLNAPFIALGEAQIARNNVGAGIAIANILATSLMSARKPTGGGGGAAGNVEVEAPDFNVVGASPESQLAQSVAEQQVKPVKAFVVGKDITNQQELDRNIVTTAGLSS